MSVGRRLVVDDAAELAREGAERIAGAFRWAVEERGRFTIALAGGSTPRGAYQALCEGRYDSLPWDRIEVYFGDERWVPEDDPDSNFHMAREALLVPRGLGPEQVFPMRTWTGGDDERAADAFAERGPGRPIQEEADRIRERAAEDYARLLPDRFDLIVLGVGEDGHTASLFPGMDAARETKRRVVPVKGPKPPPWRLTITPPVIEVARGLLVLVAGSGKAEAVARALEGPEDPVLVPAQLARRGDWIVGRAAAAKLRAPL